MAAKCSPNHRKYRQWSMTQDLEFLQWNIIFHPRILFIVELRVLDDSLDEKSDRERLAISTKAKHYHRKNILSNALRKFTYCQFSLHKFDFVQMQNIRRRTAVENISFLQLWLFETVVQSTAKVELKAHLCKVTQVIAFFNAEIPYRLMCLCIYQYCSVNIIHIQQLSVAPVFIHCLRNQTLWIRNKFRRCKKLTVE